MTIEAEPLGFEARKLIEAFWLLSKLVQCAKGIGLGDFSLVSTPFRLRSHGGSQGRMEPSLVSCRRTGTSGGSGQHGLWRSD